MRAVNLEDYENIQIPNSREQLVWSLTRVIQRVGAIRFAYLKLPENRELLKLGVCPKLLTNFPQIIADSYIPDSDSPFNLAQQALLKRGPTRMSESENAADIALFKVVRIEGIAEIVAVPISNCTIGSNLGGCDTVMLYGFEHQIDAAKVDNLKKMDQIAKLVDFIMVSRPDLCNPFIFPGYTPRTQEIFQYKILGLTNEEMAQKLGVKESTIKKTTSRFSIKMGGMTVNELIYQLAKLGVL